MLGEYSCGESIATVCLRSATVDLISDTRNKGCIIMRLIIVSTFKKLRFLAYYTASSGNCLPTFRDNLSVPYSGAKKKTILNTTHCLYPNKHKFNLTEKYVPRCLAVLLVGLGVDSKLLAYCKHWIAQQVSACCAVCNSLLLADCVQLIQTVQDY